MPELTVSMPAYNSERYIKEAIESVLKQKGIDFDLMVVDDGSTDNTSLIIKSFNDPRIILIKNKKNMGVSYCHNLVIEQSRAPYIAHVDSDDLVLPGAFLRMLNELESSSKIGQAHCYFFLINEEGKITSDSFRKLRKFFCRNIKTDMDYKKELLIRPYISDGLRFYKREVFDSVGKFNDKIKIGENYDMALRLTDKKEIKLVPEFLYCFRIKKGNATIESQYGNLIWWKQRYYIGRELSRNNKAHFLKDKKYNIDKFMFLCLFEVLFKPKLKSFVNNVKIFCTKLYGFIIWQKLIPVLNKAYYIAIKKCSWWPINLFYFKKRIKSYKNKRIAYYLWHYPVLSQTFIRREISALKNLHIDIEIMADAPWDKILSDENLELCEKDVYYLLPINKKLLKKYMVLFFFRNPMLFINLYLYVIFHKYDMAKNLKRDAVTFLKAVYLAGVLKSKNINHIHSPWADKFAFTSLVASKLLNIPYSVQARAYDIHRKTFSYALKEKFENAEFIITNSQYNEIYLKSFLGKRHWSKIHTIFNGIDLEEFKSKQKIQTIPQQIKILTVARLIEQKGLLYLLKACKILKDKGCPFKCEIIGGPDMQSQANYYFKLKKLHKELLLSDRVIFLDALPFSEVLKKYDDSDIFVLPCVIAEDGSRDVTPNALIEAMAMKLPVISTNISAIPEIVEDNISGILIPPNDEKALVEAILELAEDINLRRKLGDNARKRIEERFNINKNIIKYINLFEKAV